MTPRKPTRAKQLGVTDEVYALLLAAQGGHCALCPNTPKTRRLHVDHDHATGKVRGLLCYVCNRSLPASRGAAWHLLAAQYLNPSEELLVEWASVVSVTRAQRDARIIRARRHGWTYARIADRYGVTRQRAWQIVTKAGKA